LESLDNNALRAETILRGKWAKKISNHGGNYLAAMMDEKNHPIDRRELRSFAHSLARAGFSISQHALAVFGVVRVTSHFIEF